MIGLFANNISLVTLCFLLVYNRRLKDWLKKVENKLKEASSIILSGIDNDTMQQIQDYLNLNFTVIDWQMKITNIS